MNRLFVVLIAAGCAAGEAAPQKSPTAVRVRAVERSTGDAGARYSATINPASRVDVAFKVGGYVEIVARTRGVDGKPRLLQAGDHVSRGQELASVRKADYAQKLAEAQAAFAEATAAREQAQIDFDRVAKLLASNSIAKAQGDAARVQLEAATARLDGARVRVDEAQTALADSALRAPMEGVVLSRYVELGSLAGPGTVAFSIADTSSVKVVFGVPDTVLETLRLGSSQTVEAEALRGRELSGRITRIAPAADPKSRVFEVEISLPNADDALKAGMVVSLSLAGATAHAAPVAVLPLSAVVRPTAAGARAGRFGVFVVDAQERAHLREVELGEFLGNLIPIKSGLNAGENVVVMGASLLSDGEQVQVIP